MADISKILLPNGITYDIKDAYSRGLVIHVYYSGSGETCTCDTSIMDIGTAIENGRNIILIFNDEILYYLAVIGEEYESFQFLDINPSSNDLIFAQRNGNTDSWSYQQGSVNTGTIVKYIEWSYQ